MASDGVPATPPSTGAVTANQTRDATSVHPTRGKVLPPGGTPAAPTSAAAIEKAIAPPAVAPPSKIPKAVPADKPSQAQALVTQLNKSINDSGRPDQFRLDKSAGAPVIQEINPATGAVVGEYSEEEFPTLAQGLGLSGTLVDTRA